MACRAHIKIPCSQLKEELSDVNVDIEAMDTEEGARAKNLQMGKKKFNMDPKKGIEFLVSHSLVQETPEDVAQFLYKGEGLNKTMIGDYLGERNDFNEAVLKAFVELHDFTDLILVQALRLVRKNLPFACKPVLKTWPISGNFYGPSGCRARRRK